MQKTIIFFLTFFVVNTLYSMGDLEGRINKTSRYIVSEEFSRIKKNSGDLAALDSLYFRTIDLCDNDVSESLLVLTLATLPYSRLPVRTGIPGISFDIPLPAPAEKTFQIRKNNLPGNIFPDSPQNDFADKDKLPHFFGNAWITYNVSFFNISKFIGIFLELFEYNFLVTGALDPRDLVTNRLGELFGKILSSEPMTPPSGILKLYSCYYTILN